MRNLLQALNIVFSSKINLALGVVVAAVLGMIYLFVGGILSDVKGVYYFEFDPIRIVTFLTLSVLAGIVVPLEIFALRKATTSLKSSGVAGMGILTGLTTMSCCTPLILPAILIFFGWSVIQILEVNALIQKYLLELSALSIMALLFSLKFAAEASVAACKIKEVKV